MAYQCSSAIRYYFYSQTSLFALSLIFLAATPALAVNECGATANGGTAICNGDGVPGTDASPYAAGITYTNPVNLVVDGTATPLTINGRVGVTSNAGPQTTTITGDVSIIRSGNVPMVTVGDYTAHARDISLTLGSGVNLDLTRTTANGAFYGVAAAVSNAAISIDNSAEIDMTHSGGGGSSYSIGIVGVVNSGGGSSTLNVINNGDITMSQTAGSTVMGLYAGAFGAGSPLPVTVDNAGNITVTQTGGTTACYGITAYNLGAGSTIVNSSGIVSVNGTCGSTAVGVGVEGYANIQSNITGNISMISGGSYAYGLYMNPYTDATVTISADIHASSAAGASAVYLSTNAQTYDVTIDPGVTISTGAGTSNDAAIYLRSTNSGILRIGNGAIINGVDATTGYALITGAGSDTLASDRAVYTGLIEAGLGDDTYHIIGGSIDGGIDMQDGDDTLILDSIDAAGAANIYHVLGGAGTDTLTFYSMAASGSTMLADDLAYGLNLGDGWETIELINSQFTLTGNLTLGGSIVNIDNTSTLYAGNGINSVIESVLPGDPAIVNNAGIIDLTNGVSGPTDTLTIRGDYIGNNGRILMDAALGDSSSPTDRIIIDGSNGGGSASGTTEITVTNAGGLGAPTTGNGILLIETINGATIAPGSFTLASRTAAGAYDYDLVLAADNSFYLTTALTGVRPEVAVDSIVPDLAYNMGLRMLGTMDQRTPIRTQQGRAFQGWGRSFVEKSERGNASFGAHGTSYESKLTGAQVGIDIVNDASYLSTRDVAGLYVGVAHTNADADLAIGNGFAGNASMTGYSLGAYWTHEHDKGWYTDTVIQGTYYSNIDTRSSAGENMDTDGVGAAVSIEAGKPIPLARNVTITPQAQAIYQAIKLKDAQDSFGQIEYETADALQARLGVRIAKRAALFNDGDTEFWVTPNIWHNFSATSTTTFTTLGGANPTSFDSDLGSSRAQLDFGVAGKLAKNTYVYAAGDISTGIGRDGHAFGGRVGLKVVW